MRTVIQASYCLSHEMLVYLRSVIDCLQLVVPGGRVATEVYNTVFDTSPGHTEVVEHHISTGDGKPVFHPPYRVPSAWQENVREEIESRVGDITNTC